MVDEFAAIVRIDAEQGKGQPMPDGFQRLEGPHLRFILYRLGFCPARVHVGRVERLCVVSRRIAAAMGDQIDFDEAGFLLVPFRERADRDLMFDPSSTVSRCFGEEASRKWPIYIGFEN